MKTTISNAQRGLAAKSAAIAAPTLASLFVLAALSAVPALDLTHVLAMRQRARELAHQRNIEARVALQFENARVDERAEAARALARSALPSSGSHAAAHGLVRAAASIAGASIDGISQLEPVDAGFAQVGDVIAERRIEVYGRASVESVLQLVAWLRVMGIPCAVRSLLLESSRTERSGFAFTLRLSLFHFSAVFPTARADSLPEAPLPETP